MFVVDSDAHALGQLDWLEYGCVRAAGMGIPPERVISTRGAASLASAARH